MKATTLKEMHDLLDKVLVDFALSIQKIGLAASATDDWVEIEGYVYIMRKLTPRRTITGIQSLPVWEVTKTVSRPHDPCNIDIQHLGDFSSPREALRAAVSQVTMDLLDRTLDELDTDHLVADLRM